nr:pentatricopeptide repeat-containing protein [Tanacetum cinerariifolium]GEX89002.1 pentatricopeptide repeat-containing protein [Tanacetum cinerariifolium]
MAIDDSFKQPGMVPFKWEIKPGVPKPVVNHNKPSSKPSASSLKPPPSSPTSFHFPSPRTQSSRFQSDKPNLGRPEVVSLGCFTPRKSTSQRKTNKVNVDRVYKSDIEMLSQWSALTRRSSRSPFNGSPLSSSSFSSSRSSPRMVSVSDAEWAGYGLF